MNNDRKSHIQIIVETAEDIMYYGYHWNIYDILRETKKKAKIGLKRGFHKKLFEEALPIIVMMYYFRIISKTPTIKNQPELLLHFIPGNAQEFPAFATITSVQNALEEYNVTFTQPKFSIKERPKQKSIPNAQRPQKLTKDDKQQLERIRKGFRKTLEQYNVKNKKLIQKASLYAYAVAKDKSLLGPYSAYLRVVERSHPKTHEQRVSVWLSNYIRHCILDYDEQIWKAEVNPKRSVELFDELWNVAMEEIVRKYPRTKWAHQRGLEYKADFKVMLDTKRSALFPGVKRGKVFGIATKLNNMSDAANFPY